MTPQSPSTATVKAEAPLSARSSTRRTEAGVRSADRFVDQGPRPAQPETEDKYYDVPCTD